ncbi:hypothetical protein PDL71_17485 [Lacibacter sp. MH-610]|uniref:hypothetical protein n=1 Tax=Lacibacter sp. MH-610 TaxID=3020883 RepID=UPI003891FF08
MKQFVLIFTAFVISLGVAAQGKSGNKEKGKNKQNQEQSADANSKGKGKNNNDAKGNKEQKEHDQKIWEGTYKNEGDGPKPSKNQPAKVREAFSRDYPNVQNVTWSKYRGDWTATFRNGVFTSTAVYHANGDRRDTRTPVPRQEVPRNILEEIFKRRPQTQQNEEVIKVELPEKNRHLFRFKEIINGVANYFFVDNAGKEVNYNY